MGNAGNGHGWREGTTGAECFHPYVVPEEMLLGVGQEPRALSILAKTCLCTVKFWSFPDNQVLIRAFQWHWSCPPGLKPSSDAPVGSSKSIGSGHHPDTSGGAKQTEAWPHVQRWWPSKAHRL